MSNPLLSTLLPNWFSGSCLQAQIRHSAHHIKIHLILQIIMHIGYTVKMYQIILAIINHRHNDILMLRRQAAEKTAYISMFLQKPDDFLRACPNIVHSSGKAGIGLITKYPTLYIPSKTVPSIHNTIADYSPYFLPIPPNAGYYLSDGSS